MKPELRAKGKTKTAQHTKTEIISALIRDIPNTLACQIKNTANGILTKTTAILYIRTWVPPLYSH